MVVLGALAALILTSKGWPTVRETFFDWDAFKDSFPGVLDGFWLDIKLFVIVEIVVLILGLVVALARSGRAVHDRGNLTLPPLGRIDPPHPRLNAFAESAGWTILTTTFDTRSPKRSRTMHARSCRFSGASAR